MEPIRIEKLQNGKINIYDVSIDNKLLEEFRIRVIMEASLIEHHSYNAHYGPFFRKMTRKDLEIQNYSKEFLYVSNKGLDKGLDIYHYEYDEYHFPYLEKLIRRLQDGNKGALNEILNPDMSKEINPLKIEISKLKYLIEHTDDLDKKIIILDQIKQLLIRMKNNDYDIPVEKYYYMLKHMFNYTLVNEKELKKEL